MAPRVFARKVTQLEKQAGATARLAIAFLSATLGLVPLPSRAATVRVDNPSGSVFARVANVKEVRVRHSSPKRKVRPADTQITRQMGGEVVLVNCRPSDGAPIQVTIDIPYGSELDVRTRDADIAINGLIARANLTTDSGDIRLTVPWAAMRLSIDSEQKPQHYQGPEGYEFTESKRFSRAGETWHLQDDLGFGKITFGSILVKAKSPGQIVLKDAPIPHDSPVKLPWQAPAILDELLGLQEPSERADAAAGPRRSGSAGGEPGEVLFTSDVRLVNLMVSVTGRVGVRGLRKEDFEILEDGERQEIDSISSDEVPFNLVLLLDWSGSTENDREAMLEAVRGFCVIPFHSSSTFR